MNFDLSAEQRAIREAFARFVDERVVPQAGAIDEAHAFPHQLFGELGRLGLFGMRYPEDVGGSGTPFVERGRKRSLPPRAGRGAASSRVTSSATSAGRAMNRPERR